MILCINPSCHNPENADDLLFCNNCGSQLLLEGRYRATRVLSKKGGFANTYAAIDQQQHSRVLKVLKNDNPKALELFRREFEVLSDLNCEGIPAVYDLFDYYPRNSPQPLYCLAMEKIAGIDLEEYIKTLGQPIASTVAINWLSQLAQILQQLHDRGVLHRDIKPSNIILQPDGKLVLIDFGAAKQAAQTNSQATYIYTPGYAAPEQERGEISDRSDLFALGRTFVYLLTATEPVDLYNPNTDSLVWRERTKNIPPELLDLIDRLMAKASNQRPQNAATILRQIPAITASIANRNVGPSGTTGFTRSTAALAMASRRPRKNWWWLLLPLFGLTAIALAFFLFKDRNVLPNLAGNSQYFTQIKDIPSGEFKFGGSTSWATTRQSQSSVDAAIQGVYPQFKLIYTTPNPILSAIASGKCPSTPGSNTGICLLLAGDLDFAQSSISLAKSKYADRIASDKLQEIAVGYDALTIVVNPQLRVSQLTVEQIRDIYTGAITNWREVGGDNLPIVAFSRNPNAGGTVASFQDLVLGKGRDLNFQVVRQVNSPTEGLQNVRNNIGGIFYGSAKETIVDFCKAKPLQIVSNNTPIAPYRSPLKSPSECEKGSRNQINFGAIKNQEYPLTRKMYVIYKADGGNSQKAGEAYGKLLTTAQGGDLLEKAGFVRIDR